MLKRSVYRVDFPLLEPDVLWKRINDREEGLRKEVDSNVVASFAGYDLFFYDENKRVVARSFYPLRSRIELSIKETSDGSFAECRVIPDLIYDDVFIILLAIYMVFVAFALRAPILILAFGLMLALYLLDRSILSQISNLLRNTLIDIQESQEAK